MSKLKCYYAHTMLSYGSTIEKKDIETLEKLGFEVLNPNQEWIQEEVKQYIEENGRDKTMDYFKKLIDTCEVVAFRANPDGNILSGIAFELKYSAEKSKPIIELPSSMFDRMWDYPKTKQYLIEVGHYKV